MKSYKLFFDIEFLDRFVLAWMRLKIKFRDRVNTIEQVWGPKRVISKFMDCDDTIKQFDRDNSDEQIWGPKRSICKFRDRDDTTVQV